MAATTLASSNAVRIAAMKRLSTIYEARMKKEMKKGPARYDCGLVA